MQIQTFPLGELRANCYFVIQDKDLIIIDPADSADFILEEIQRRNLQLKAMIATHGHFDHIMAAGEIQLSFNVPLYIHDEDIFLVKRLSETAKHFLGYDPTVIKPSIIKSLTADTISGLPFPFQLIHTPGHTPGSVSLVLKDEQVVFTGDTLFKQAVGSYKHAYSDKAKLFHSIKKLFELPAETTIYSGHGEETIIEEEKKYFTF